MSNLQVHNTTVSDSTVLSVLDPLDVKLSKRIIDVDNTAAANESDVNLSDEQLKMAADGLGLFLKLSASSGTAQAITLNLDSGVSTSSANDSALIARWVNLFDLGANDSVELKFNLLVPSTATNSVTAGTGAIGFSTDATTQVTNYTGNLFTGSETSGTTSILMVATSVTSGAETMTFLKTHTDRATAALA